MVGGSKASFLVTYSRTNLTTEGIPVRGTNNVTLTVSNTGWMVLAESEKEHSPPEPNL
jgi:hypothetical protein